MQSAAASAAAGGRERILVGTSGYSYAEWVPAGIYPPGTRPGGMLPIYAAAFPATELNYTWYQMPKAPALERMLAQVPPDFRFAVKLTRSLTHEVETDQWRGQAARFREGVDPLGRAGRLAAVLVQLPPAFDRTLAHRRYLAALLDELAGMPLAHFLAARTPIDSLDALKNAPLTVVDVSGCRALKDLGPLTGLKKLEYVNADRSPVCWLPAHPLPASTAAL